MNRRTILKVIKEAKNPYPKDVFCWDTQEDMKITRGRFNQFVFQTWENCKEDIAKRIMEEDD